MTFQISQRGKGCLTAVQTMLRVGQAMADGAIADRLKVLADDCQRRAEKASHVDAAKAFAPSAVYSGGGRLARYLLLVPSLPPAERQK
jgi:hypothetical protein